MPKTLSLLAVLKKVDAKGVKSLSNAQWDTFLASDTEPNEIQDKIKKLEGLEEKGATYDATGDLIPEDNQAMIDRFKARTGRASGRESLKTKRSKIDVSSFKKDFLNKKSNTGGASALSTISKSPGALGSSPDKGEETEGLKGIRDVLDEILGVLRLDFKDDRKEARDRQKEDNKKKRTKKEDKLEGGVKKSIGLIGKSLKAIVSPFSTIWDAVFKFLKFTLLNVLFVKTLDWFGDPKNEKKAERIGKFFKDWWPALATAAALWLTPLGALLNGMVGLLTAIIPKLVLAIAANPWAATAVLGTVAIWGLSKKIGNMQGGDGGDESEEVTTMNGGGLVDDQTSAQNFIHNFNEGGVVPGGESTGKGPDTSHFGKTGYRMGQVRPEMYVYGNEKFVSTYKTKDGKVIEDSEDYSEIMGSIAVEDLIANQKQLMGEINKVKGFENANIIDVMERMNKRGRLVDMPDSQLYPILNASDAYKATDAKRDAAIRIDMESGTQFLDPTKTAKIVGLNKGGGVPGSGNKDTVPAMLTPGEFVMSKGAVQKYGMGTLANMNAAAGGGSSKKNDTVPSMLTPGEFVVSAPAVQKFGVNTLEAMNLKGGGTNKPTLMQYKGGGSVPQGWKRWLAGAADVATGGIFDLDKRGSIGDGIQRMRDKGAVDTPNKEVTNKTVTLPTIPKNKPEETVTSKNDIPEFRISMISTQRSMVLSTLGIQDLIGGA